MARHVLFLLDAFKPKHGGVYAFMRHLLEASINKNHRVLCTCSYDEEKEGADQDEIKYLNHLGDKIELVHPDLEDDEKVEFSNLVGSDRNFEDPVEKVLNDLTHVVVPFPNALEAFCEDGLIELITESSQAKIIVINFMSYQTDNTCMSEIDLVVKAFRICDSMFTVGSSQYDAWQAEFAVSVGSVRSNGSHERDIPRNKHLLALPVFSYFPMLNIEQNVALTRPQIALFLSNEYQQRFLQEILLVLVELARILRNSRINLYIFANNNLETVKKQVRSTKSIHQIDICYADLNDASTCSWERIKTEMQKSHMCITEGKHTPYEYSGIETITSGIPTLVPNYSENACFLKQAMSEIKGLLPDIDIRYFILSFEDTESRSKDIDLIRTYLEPNIEKRIDALQRIAAISIKYVETANTYLATFHELMSSMLPEKKLFINFEDIQINKTGLLGRGSFGKVYRGMYKNEQIAVKVMDVGSDEFFLNSAQKEIEILEGLRHKHVIFYYGSCYYEHDMYIILELANYCMQQPPPDLDDQTKLQIAIGACKGVAYLHEMRIIHQDIKPANILVKDNTAKITDFGVSRIKKRKGKTTTISPSQAQGQPGTHEFVSPEVLLHYERKDRSSDVWALACTLALWFPKSGKKPPNLWKYMKGKGSKMPPAKQLEKFYAEERTLDILSEYDNKTGLKSVILCGLTYNKRARCSAEALVDKLTELQRTLNSSKSMPSRADFHDNPKSPVEEFGIMPRIGPMFFSETEPTQSTSRPTQDIPIDRVAKVHLEQPQLQAECQHNPNEQLSSSLRLPLSDSSDAQNSLSNSNSSKLTANVHDVSDSVNHKGTICDNTNSVFVNNTGVHRGSNASGSSISNLSSRNSNNGSRQHSNSDRNPSLGSSNGSLEFPLDLKNSRQIFPTQESVQHVVHDIQSSFTKFPIQGSSGLQRSQAFPFGSNFPPLTGHLFGQSSSGGFQVRPHHQSMFPENAKLCTARGRTQSDGAEDEHSTVNNDRANTETEYATLSDSASEESDDNWHGPTSIESAPLKTKQKTKKRTKKPILNGPSWFNSEVDRIRKSSSGLGGMHLSK